MTTSNTDLRQGWKVLTHDYRPPVQGGAPLYAGEPLPFRLPETALDTSNAECSYGWNYCASLATALKIAKLWPRGRPSVAFAVEAGEDAIQRGDKRRTSQLALIRPASDTELQAAIRELSAPFGAHAGRMAEEQWAWRQALARPGWDPEAVQCGLKAALEARGLSWRLRRFETKYAARDARYAWHAWDARAAWAAWAAWAARAARDARDAWDARDARDARDAWDAWDARDAWAARDARDARDALTLVYASLMGWVTYQPDHLTAGIRGAYANGLALAVPTGPDELGWVMCERSCT